jgi:hypothetical protein
MAALAKPPISLLRQHVEINMISFPVFEQLNVSGFGLYPGTSRNRGLNVHFQPGLTLVLGANGLGKTTLITIMYRLLAGPYDIPALVGGGELGNASLEPKPLTSGARGLFAARVTDGAQNATARLQLRIGNTPVTVERRLRDLALTDLLINGKPARLDEVGVFQSEVSRLVGVWSFGDWILLLRHMVFYFEDRRALVWDSSAQRQLLRFLLLPPDTARKWTQDEREILELDSRMRNLRFAAYREEQALIVVETKTRTAAQVRKELETLERLQSADLATRENLDNEFVEIDTRRQRARLRHLRAQQERESRYRALERAKLLAVEARFPQKSETARYILQQLFAEAECLVCGKHVPKAAKAIEQRIAANLCVVCGSDLSEPSAPAPPVSLADRRVTRAQHSLEAIEPEVAEAAEELAAIEKEFSQSTSQLEELDLRISERTLRVDALIKRLPPGEAEIHKQRAELASMRSRVEALTRELLRKRDLFSAFVDDQNRSMVKRSAQIMTAFSQFASGFLLETVQLVWSPQSARVGQTGDPIQFPGFELDMSGTNFPSPVRRSGPDHVSESQREFIDLAFRMALMEVASSTGLGSLVIDAPESSLDAVFVTRAADVLARFARPKGGNRLTITSNLVEGHLIPELLKRAAPSGNRMSRIVDLFKIAEPTAAIRELGKEYREIMRSLMAQVEPTKKRPKKVASKRASQKRPAK